MIAHFTGHVCALTVMTEEIAVDDVNHAVELLLDQPTQRDLQDELREQLAARIRQRHNEDKGQSDRESRLR